MTTPATPSSPQPAGDDRNLVSVDEKYVPITFEDRLHRFWQTNRNLVMGLCVAVLLAILAKGAWEYLARQKELDVEKAYAAATTTEQLKTFASSHASHSLAGIAYLRMGDEGYAAGKSADALAAYGQAIAILKDGPLAARIQTGRALSKIQAGKTSEGTAELKQLAGDPNQFNAVRSEAAYQLASLAAEAGNAAAMAAATAAAVMNWRFIGTPWNGMVLILPGVPGAAGRFKINFVDTDTPLLDQAHALCVLDHRGGQGIFAVHVGV